MLLGKRDQCPIGVGVWLSVPCVFSRLARSLALGFGATGSSAATARNAASRYGTFTPCICIFGDCKLAAIVGGAPRKGAALSSAGAGVQGVVSLAFTIDRHGGVMSSRIVKSSGSTVLDAEALDLIKRAALLPPPPADVADSELSFVVPIRFAAR